MSSTTIEAIRGEDGAALAFDYEVNEALAKAIDAVMAASGEASHFVSLPDGRYLAGFDVVEETLSDGSKAYSIQIIASDDL